MCLALMGCLAPNWCAGAVTFGGDAALTTDDIYRGYSLTDHEGAAQLDLHVSSSGGTFVGMWTSSLDHNRLPYAAAQIETYLGQRFALGTDWNASLTASNYSYVGGQQYFSSDYQQIAASVSYLDRWSLTVAAIPSTVRYWYEYRLGRYSAYDAATTGQWWVIGGLYLTGGVGYYWFTGGRSQPGLGYVYGNVGLAYEWRDWRLDVGYFLTQGRIEEIIPYASANGRVAATLSWRF